MFKSNQVVLARRPDAGPSLWVPAVMQSDPERDVAVVKFLGGLVKGERRLSLGREVVAFADEVNPVKFKDRKVQRAFAEARGMRDALLLPVVNISRSDEEDASGFGSSDLGTDSKRKDDFLASLDSDSEEDKENSSLSKDDPKLKMKATVRIPLQKLKTAKLHKTKAITTKRRESAPPKEELSEYEKIRLKNIEDRQKMFAALKADFKAYSASLAPAPIKKRVANGDIRKQRRFMPYFVSRLVLQQNIKYWLKSVIRTKAFCL